MNTNNIKNKNVLKSLIKKESMFILTYLVNTFVLVVVFNLKLDKIYFVYPVILSLFIAAVYLVLKYIQNKVLASNVENMKIPNYVPNFTLDQKDELYFALIKDLHFDYNRQLNTLIESNKSTSYMFSQLIHNMKTSVSIIELASKSSNENALQDIINENVKLKEQLEQSLNILRLGEFAKDYLPQKSNLVELVKNVINNNKANFIYNNVFPKFNYNSENLDEYYVFTDEKWCSYIINQVLSNAIKYSNGSGNIYFNLYKEDKKLTLEIIDEGIGIPEVDLDRVFELFYTGQNGRTTGNATGIGLAMVKNVANFLGVSIKLTSELEKGTKVSLIFDNIHEN